MPTSLDNNAAAILVPWLTLSWHETTVRYVRLDDDVSIASMLYTSAPELDVSGLRLQGGTDVESCVVTLRVDRPPLDKLLRPYPHAEITAVIGEVDPDEPGTSSRTVFKGVVQSSKRNEPGRRGLARLTIAGLKRKLTIPLGIVASEQCVHAFGDSGCGFSVPDHNVTITSIVGRAITWSGFTAPTATYAAFGQIERQGLRIGIASQVTTTSAVLLRPPPPEWLNQTATLMPGCDKLYGGGCTYWGNRAQFLGLGARMLPYNPLVGGG